MEKIIVLRDLRLARGEDPFSAGIKGWPGHADGPPEPAVDVVDAQGPDLVRLRKAPGWLADGVAVPTLLIRPTSVGSATCVSSWGVGAIGADGSEFDGAGVTVAILDTGIDREHPAFEGVNLVERDFTGAGNGDRHGHGTHCAGTIFGRDVAGGRIGIARGVTHALIGKILGDDGSGSSEMILQGIQWANEEGADVISMSVGLDFPGHVASLISANWPAALATSRALEAYRKNLRLFDTQMSMLRARDDVGLGGIVVAAAGNESRRDLDAEYTIGSSLPAAADGVLSVAAAGFDTEGLAVAAFSNTFPDVAAPGVDIVSARAGQGTCAMSGTSMACPHVAGAAALWWQKVAGADRKRAADKVRTNLLASARTDRFAGRATDENVGAGLVMAP